MTNDTQASPYSLRHVSNDDLHAGTRRLVGRSNQVLATLLAHLAEVEARGLHRERACSSLVSYCVFELRMSEDEACRRAQAARLARKFPIVFERVAAGEIHLTGLLLLGPHLTRKITWSSWNARNIERKRKSRAWCEWSIRFPAFPL